jgi:hypothetical protein
MTQLVPHAGGKLSPPSGITEARGQEAELLIVVFRRELAGDRFDPAEASCAATLCDLLCIKDHGDLLHLIHGLDKLADVIGAGAYSKLDDAHLLIEVTTADLLFAVGIALLDVRVTAGLASDTLPAGVPLRT